MSRPKSIPHSDFSRPVTLYLEHDGTLTYAGQRSLTTALPVFTVETEEDAKAMQVRFCRHRYDGTWGWTDFSGELTDVENARLQMRQFYSQNHGTAP